MVNDGWLVNVKTNSSPAFTGSILVMPPEITMSPGSSDTPNSNSLFASHAVEIAG
jgi:hypothetical protein